MLDLQERPPTLEGVMSKVDEILATADLKLKKAAEFNLKVTGGGVSGQAQAAQLAVSRALTRFFPEVKKDIRSA
jgi:ribosomal protein S9